MHNENGAKFDEEMAKHAFRFGMKTKQQMRSECAVDFDSFPLLLSSTRSIPPQFPQISFPPTSISNCLDSFAQWKRLPSSAFHSHTNIIHYILPTWKHSKQSAQFLLMRLRAINMDAPLTNTVLSSNCTSFSTLFYYIICPTSCSIPSVHLHTRLLTPFHTRFDHLANIRTSFYNMFTQAFLMFVLVHLLYSNFENIRPKCTKFTL